MGDASNYICHVRQISGINLGADASRRAGIHSTSLHLFAGVKASANARFGEDCGFKSDIASRIDAPLPGTASVALGLRT
jgi:hypothetical protein